MLTAGKQASLSSDCLVPGAVRTLVDNAIAAAGFLSKDPDLLPLLGEDTNAHWLFLDRLPKRFDARTAKYSPADRATDINTIVEVAKLNNLYAAGTFSTGSWLLGLGNSQGLSRFDKQTSAECSITMRADRASVNDTSANNTSGTIGSGAIGPTG